MAKSDAPAQPEHDPGGVEYQTCIACGQRDNHPKHGVAPDPTTTVYHHYDCGGRMSPPCGSQDPVIQTVCQVVPVGFDGKAGSDMRAHAVETIAKAKEEGVL